MTNPTGDLNERLLLAHAEADCDRLVSLYREAADRAEAAGDLDRGCYFLTHAWIFALETARPEAATLKARLVAHGRDTE